MLRTVTFCAFAVVLSISTQLPAANKLQIEAQTVNVGQTGVSIPIKLDNDQNLYGFSLSLSTDAAKLKITGVDLTGTTAAMAGWSFGQVLLSGARVSWGVVLDVTEPFDTAKVIPVGQKLVIANLKVDVTAAAATSATVSFQDFAGDPVAKNLLVGNQGVSMPFTTSNGTITISAPPPTEVFRRGDSDGTGSMDLTDAVRILGFLFLGQGTLDCLEAADSDDNGAIELTDAVRILNYLFQGAAPPPAPGPPPAPCGPDPAGSVKDLGCDKYETC